MSSEIVRNSKLRRIAFVVGGLLVGWVVIGTGLALVVQVLLYYVLRDALTRDIVFWVSGFVIIAGIVGGGVIGDRLSRRPPRDRRMQVEMPQSDKEVFGTPPDRPTSNETRETSEVGGGRPPGLYRWDGRGWTTASGFSHETTSKIIWPWVVAGASLMVLGGALVGVSVYMMVTDLRFNYVTEDYTDLNYEWIAGIVAGGVVVLAGLFALLVAAVAKGARIAISRH